MLTRTLPSVSRLSRLKAALTWPAAPEAYRRLVDPLATATGFRARVVRVDPESSRAVTVVLRPGAGWPRHRPGQWVALGVDIDGVRHTRCYSLTSVPGREDGCVSVTVQAVPGGTVSEHLTRSTSVGDLVHLDEPQGDFVLPPVRTAPLLFITGGSGVTPVMGMLRSLAADRSMGDVVLLHHGPTENEVLFAEELEHVARNHPTFRSEIAITGHGAPTPDTALTAGRLDQICTDWRRRETWVCGPGPLLDAARLLWSDTRVRGRLHVEQFTPARPPTDHSNGQVTFNRSGHPASTAGTDGSETLLGLAESEGLSPLSGCRMGVCRRCVVPLHSGSVRNLRDGRIESGPGAHVQICVSAAVGDVTIEI